MEMTYQLTEADLEEVRQRTKELLAEKLTAKIMADLAWKDVIPSLAEELTGKKFVQSLVGRHIEDIYKVLAERARQIDNKVVRKTLEDLILRLHGEAIREAVRGQRGIVAQHLETQGGD